MYNDADAELGVMKKVVTDCIRLCRYLGTRPGTQMPNFGVGFFSSTSSLESTMRFHDVTSIWILRFYNGFLNVLLFCMFASPFGSSCLSHINVLLFNQWPSDWKVGSLYHHQSSAQDWFKSYHKLLNYTRWYLVCFYLFMFSLKMSLWCPEVSF